MFSIRLPFEVNDICDYYCDMSQPYFSKIILDIFGSVLGIIFLIPFLPFIAIAIKLDSKGPIFVRLPRVSRGRMVNVYKFRSMVPGAQNLKYNLVSSNERNDGPFFKIRNDPRVTRVGKFLRKTRLDEFPQLFNVLKGELALVGPRPHEPEEIAKYPEEYRELIESKAGVTGLSQVSGASSLPFLRELELDSYYIKNQSFVFDIKIIFKTVEIFFTDPTAV